MGRKAKIKAKKKQERLNIADSTNQHLINIGIKSKGKNGKFQASRALVEGYIPGWRYDFNRKIAYRIGQDNGLIVELNFDETNCRELPDKYLKIQNLQSEAKLFLEKKRMSAFKQTLVKLKELYPNNLEANDFVNGGCLFSNRGYFDKAISHFNVAVWLNPYHSLAYYNRGICYSRLGNYQKALDNFNISIEIDPGDADAYGARGKLLLQYGQPQNAILDHNRAITIDPNHPHVYLNLGAAFSALQNYQRAIENFNRAIQINSKDADAYYNRAFAYRQLEYYQEALNDYEKSTFFYKQQGKAYDYQDSLNRISETKIILKSKLAKKANKIIIFEDETVKNSNNRIIVEVRLQYLEDNNEFSEQYYDLVLKKDNGSYDERIQKLIKQATSRPWAGMQWTNP